MSATLHIPEATTLNAQLHEDFGPRLHTTLPGPNAAARPIKIKEDHQLALVAATGSKAGEFKSVECYPYELTADLLPPDNHGEPDYPRYAGDYPPYAPYPFYAGFYGYPYGYYPGFYGYPFAYGIGFGYYGGFGYHGGFRR